MKRFLISLALLFAPLAPAQAYWEYGHETVAHIAQANMSPKARADAASVARGTYAWDTEMRDAQYRGR